MFAKDLPGESVNVEVSRIVDLLEEREKNLAKPMGTGTFVREIIEQIVDLGGETKKKKGEGCADKHAR